jgi:hypothetical protein
MAVAQAPVIVAPAPEPLAPAPATSEVIVVPPASEVIVTPSGTVLPPGTVLDNTRRVDIVTEPGGMTPQESRDTAGQIDRATGQVTAPGYMGPRDAKGQ